MRDDDLVTLRDGSGLPAASAPRPYLHPVRSRRGVVLTAAAPTDHSWHLGLGFVVPDVDGSNLWGGGTFRREDGYRLRADHGRQVLLGVRRTGSDLVLDVAWQGRDGRPVLHERRTHAWAVLGEDTWILTLRSELVADRPVPLASPGSHGRTGAGYGGWFWRLPACSAVEVRTPDAAGEHDVHGTTAPWLSWSADFPGGPATLLFRGDDVRTTADPWFVRVADYPAVGSAVAWDAPTLVEPGVPLTRTLRIVIADGRRDPDSLLVGGAARSGFPRSGA